jgi:hypothetical protein
MTYGLSIPRGNFGPRGVIGAVEQSVAGNIVLHAGRENHGCEGWTKTEHIVMEPEEARELIAELIRTTGPPPLDAELLRAQAHGEWEVAKMLGADDTPAMRWQEFTEALWQLCDLYVERVEGEPERPYFLIENLVQYDLSPAERSTLERMGLIVPAESLEGEDSPYHYTTTALAWDDLGQNGDPTAVYDLFDAILGREQA